MQYWKPEAEQSRECARCGLPVDRWPTVVPAHWWGDAWEVYLPNADRRWVQGSRRKAQNQVRSLVAELVPNFKIKWIDRS